MKKRVVVTLLVLMGGANCLDCVEASRFAALAILNGARPNVEMSEDASTRIETILKNADVITAQPTLPEVLRLRGGGEGMASEMQKGCGSMCKFLGWFCCCGCCCKMPCNKPCEDFDK